MITDLSPAVPIDRVVVFYPEVNDESLDALWVFSPALPLTTAAPPLVDLVLRLDLLWLE